MNCACKVNYDHFDHVLRKYVKILLLERNLFIIRKKVSGIPLDTDADLDVQTLIGFQELLHMPGI